MPVFVAAREEPAVAVPAYLEVRRDVLAARVVRDARREEVPVTCDEQLVIEYYAR
jgi:small subunit ribosomal protein S4